VFSPRIQSYQVTVEPNGDGWTSDSIDTKMSNVTMTWLGESSSERGSMFRRSYGNRVDVTRSDDEQQFASGLENVPIQVWSTKAFSATWATNFDPEKPLVVSTLRLANARAEQPDGSITLNLPIEKLDNVQLLYRDNAYDLGTLISGNPKRFVANGTSATKWMQNDFPAGSSDSQATRYARQNDGPVAYRLWGAMFHDMLDTSSSFTNASVRKLDQSWRISKENLGQAVLIGRIPTNAGQAEDLMVPNQSPTRLWLTELPGANVERTPIPGTLRQETYIRVMIPIR